MAAPLYQQIMNVPGLSGTWKQRLAQYYKALTGKTYQGSLNEGLYMLDQIAKKNYPQVAQAQAQAPAAQTGTGAAELVAELAPNLPTNFGEVLPFEQFFPRELAQGSAEQAFAQYYAPLVQRAQEGLESEYASRGLTRSGVRGSALSDMYRQYGQEQQKGIEADVMQQRAMAQEDYNRMQQLYESSAGKQKPATTTYTPYQVAQPKTAAGTYGSSYLDWLNRAIRV